MREISYKCDICKQNREPSELTPFSATDDAIKLIDTDEIKICPIEQHICDICIDIIYRYREDQIKEIDTIERERGA